jgi:hypothetical protein
MENECAQRKCIAKEEMKYRNEANVVQTKYLDTHDNSIIFIAHLNHIPVCQRLAVKSARIRFPC